jgi:hypothetical protein
MFTDSQSHIMIYYLTIFLICFPRLNPHMHQHAMRTAATLYAEGTWDVETAARQAGVTPTELKHVVERYGLTTTELEFESTGRVRVAAD